MAANRTARRYYAYSQTLGRKRLNDALSLDEAVTAAKALGAVNVVQEDGPPSKPIDVRIVWETVPRALTTTVWDADGNAFSVRLSDLTPA